MIAAERSEISDPGAFGYACPHGRDHCLFDVDMIAIPGPGEASVASPLSLLGTEGEAFLSFYNNVKPKSEWPSASVIKSKRVLCRIKPSQYPILLTRLLEAKMVTLLDSDDTVVENSIFGVWKNAGVSQRLIWAGNRSNRLFREEASSIELPTAAAYHHSQRPLRLDCLPKPLP